MFKILKHNLSAWDINAFMKLAHWHAFKPVGSLMRILSFLGNGYLYAAIIPGVLILDPGNARTVIRAGSVAYAIGMSLSTLLKRSIRRARPFENLPEIMAAFVPRDRFSFPSGHAASAFIAAVLLSHFYPFLMFPALGIASLIGISRVYNGVHYPGDVLAGILLGIVSAQLGLSIVL